MATFYNDSTRRKLFADRATNQGPLSGPARTPLGLLEWSPAHVEAGAAIPPQPLIETNAQALFLRPEPRLRIIFAPLDVPKPETALGVQALFEHFSIPSDFISQRLESVTHSFGANFEGSSYSSWFHFMCKNVTSVPGQPLLIADPRGNTLSQGDWTWVRTSVFLKWTNCHDSTVTTVTLVVFSAPLKLRERFSRLWDPDLGHILTDPFSLFAICLDELWLQAQGIYDTVRRVFGDMERNTLNSALQADNAGRHHDFVGLHNLAKHIIFLKEGSEASLSMAKRVTEVHLELLKEPPQGKDTTPLMRLNSQILSQKTMQFEVWKLRMDSMQQRMQNIINLSFNLVTQRDSHVLMDDSKSMKAIAYVIMLFLPLATVAAIFGSQFFNFNDKSKTIHVASDFWIFWALIAPFTVAVPLVYYYLCHARGWQRGPDVVGSRSKSE